jgi:ketosteroid isomerase-like protein
MIDLVAVDYHVRQLHARFVDAVWRQDADGFSGCFARDAVWKIAGMEMTGRAEIADGCRRLLGRCEHIRLIVGQPILSVGEDGVLTSRVYVTEMTRLDTATQVIVFGAYFDHYVEEDGGWRFARRHWSFHYRGPFAIGEYNPYPDYGPPPGMPALDEPTYVRPQA